MKALIAEDDFVSREIIKTILQPYGICDIAVNGTEAVNLFMTAQEKNEHYDLICMDIMMPSLDGRAALKEIRRIEQESGVKDSNEVKVIMTTALDDPKTVIGSFKEGATAYLTKPIKKEMLLEQLRSFGIAFGA